jgi:hypothetical protein
MLKQLFCKLARKRYLLLNIVFLTIVLSLKAISQDFTLGLWAIWPSWVGHPITVLGTRGFVPPGLRPDSEISSFQDINANFLIACMGSNSNNNYEQNFMSYCDETQISSILNKTKMCVEIRPNHYSTSISVNWAPTAFENLLPDSIAWQNNVISAIDDMWSVYNQHLGLSSFLLGQEIYRCNYRLSEGQRGYQVNRWPGLQYICRQFHQRHPSSKTVLVGAVGNNPSDPNYSNYYFTKEFFTTVIDLDILQNECYPFRLLTTYTGNMFQDSLQYQINSWDSTRVYLQNSTMTKWEAIIQSQAQAISTGPRYRRPTESEIRCQSYTAISRGAKGINTYSYGTSDGEFGLVGAWNGTNRPKNDPYFTYVKNLYGNIKKLGPTLMKLKVVDAFNQSAIPRRDRKSVV